MRETLEKFITNNENGMFLLDSPTGFGKTTAVLEILKSFLKGEKFDDIYRMFFITNLKTNLPVDKLFDQLSEKEKENCVWIKAYDDGVIENWGKVKITKSAITNSKEYKALKADIDVLQELVKEKEQLFSEGKPIFKKIKSIEGFKKKISNITEPEFRQMIERNYFYGESVINKKKFIKENEWFRKLYPVCELEKKKVIFMTTKKFFLPMNLFYRINLTNSKKKIYQSTYAHNFYYEFNLSLYS